MNGWLVMPQKKDAVMFGPAPAVDSFRWYLLYAEEGVAKTWGTFDDEKLARRCMELLNRNGMVDCPLILDEGAQP